MIYFENTSAGCIDTFPKHVSWLASSPAGPLNSVPAAVRMLAISLQFSALVATKMSDSPKASPHETVRSSAFESSAPLPAASHVATTWKKTRKSRETLDWKIGDK